MSWFKVLAWLLPRRVRSSWPLLAVTSFGILAAVILMATGAIYSRALAEGGLRHTLASTHPTVLNVLTIVENRPLAKADYQRLHSIVDDLSEEHLGNMLEQAQRFGRTQSDTPIVFSDRPPTRADAIGRFFFLTDFQKHTRLLEGRWPDSTPVIDEEGLKLEVFIGEPMAVTKDLDLGSAIYVTPIRSDISDRITLTVVGIGEPSDPTEEYWMGFASSYFNEQEVGNRLVDPIYVTEEAYLSSLGTHYPALVGDYGWIFFLDPTVLTASMVGPTKDAMADLESDLNKSFPRSKVLSGIVNTLTQYEEDLTIGRIPLFLFISLVVVVVLYFLAMVMGLLARVRSDEASLLRSRGASIPQVSGLLALGEGIVVILSMILGPFLALLIVHYVLLETINPVGGDVRPFSVGLSADMFVMGAIGGLLSLVVLMVSYLALARLGVVEFLRARARPPSVPFLQRYYIDLLVLAAVGLVIWQIQDRGSFAELDVLDKAIEVDPTLLLGPVLALLAVALVIMRLLPLLMRVIAWVGTLLGPAWIAFTLTRIARDPVPHGSLAIILMMAAALGVFGATFESTLSRSQMEQALYNTGGDLVVKSSSISTTDIGNLASVEGVQAVSPMGRYPVTLKNNFRESSAIVLAVDPHTLDDTAWFRSDFSPTGKNLSEMLEVLATRGNSITTPATSGQSPGGKDSRIAQGIAIPEDTVSIGVWINADNMEIDSRHPGLSLWARLSTESGLYSNLFLGDVPIPKPTLGQPNSANSGQGWKYLEGTLDLEEDSIYKPPFTLVSIFISGGSVFSVTAGSVTLDEITVKGPSTPPDGLVIEGFEGNPPLPWAALAAPGVASDVVSPTAQGAPNGRAGLTLSWQEPLGGEPRGIFIPPGPFPLPAIGGPGFTSDLGILVRAGSQHVPLVIRDITDYFPTINPETETFMVVNIEDYREYIRRIPGGLITAPSEVWASLEDTADRVQVSNDMDNILRGFASFTDRIEEADEAQRNPLAGGGWNSLTIISMTALTIAVVLALGTYAAVSVATARIDITVARALGLTGRQIMLSLTLERVLVAVIGIATGTAMGIWLAVWLLKDLDITASGGLILPPMILTIHQWLMVLVFIDLGVALVLAVVFATVVARRLRASDILRAGE